MIIVGLFYALTSIISTTWILLGVDLGYVCLQFAMVIEEKVIFHIIIYQIFINCLES